MDNFTFWNPVRLVFGKGTISELANLLPKRKKIFFLYGGGSIKKNGVYEKCLSAIQDRKIVEFGGIEPNPSYETCMEAVSVAKKKKIGFILAVGGGSVLDAAKFIAAAICYGKGDPWDILAKQKEVKDAIPIGAVLTLPATGSEMNQNSVISRRSTQEKLHFASPLVYPQFSILDPETTYSLPARQTINGIVDAFVHVMEQYMTYDNDTPLQDKISEAIVSVLMEEAPKVLTNPENYSARANIMWAATNALNGWCSCGAVQDWATHMIGHELTAFYGIDHAQSLAIVLPRLWQEQFESKKAKLANFARRIFKVCLEDDNHAASEAISKTEQFFNSIGMKTRLADYGIDSNEAAEKIRQRFISRGNVALGEKGEIDAEKAAKILLKC